MAGIDGVEERDVTIDGVRAAARRIEGMVRRTPLLECPVLNEIAGGRVLLKAECLQHGGAFKLRGACNTISRLPQNDRARGIIAWSSGNHAIAVAMMAKAFDCPAVIVMPEDAPSVKIENVRKLDGEIVFYDRCREDREAVAHAIRKERGLNLVPSYDHPDVIEGQGTVGLETLLQASETPIDRFVVCCGGGGLASGIATVLDADAPDTELWIAEPTGFDETWASVQAGHILSADKSKRTICDAIATPMPGRLTFPILKRQVRGGASVSDDDVRLAMFFAFRHLKLVVEPGGAAALAAILAGKVPTRGNVTAVTLSGGNVDAQLFASILRDDNTIAL